MLIVHLVIIQYGFTLLLNRHYRDFFRRKIEQGLLLLGQRVRLKYNVLGGELAPPVVSCRSMSKKVTDFPDTYREVVQYFPDDHVCARYPEKLRWPNGFCCPACRMKVELR